MVASNGNSEKHHTNDQPQGMPEGPTLGQYLRSEREKRQLTIAELHEKTGINLSSLNALEHDLRHELPADVFVRGFIKLYAQALSLDPQKALALFQGRVDTGAKNPDAFTGRDLLSSESLAESPPFTRKKLLLCLLLILLGILAYIVFRYKPMQDLKIFPFVGSEQQISPSVKTSFPPRQQNPSVQQKTVPGNKGHVAAGSASQPGEIAPPGSYNTVVAEPADHATPHFSPHTKTAPSPPESGNATGEKTISTEEKEAFHTLTATFAQMTWVRTVVDHKEAKESFFKPGSTATWRAKANIEIVLGNSGGVSLVFDGAPVDLHGNAAGKVLRLSFPNH